MALLMNVTLMVIFLLSFANCVAADVRYVGPTIGGILGLIVLILDIIAAVEILRSGKPLVEKVLWILLIVFFPLIGLIVYFLCGRTRSAGI